MWLGEGRGMGISYRYGERQKRHPESQENEWKSAAAGGGGIFRKSQRLEREEAPRNQWG
jgi:hypothetical protein